MFNAVSGNLVLQRFFNYFSSPWPKNSLSLCFSCDSLNCWIRDDSAVRSSRLAQNHWVEIFLMVSQIPMAGQ